MPSTESKKRAAEVERLERRAAARATMVTRAQLIASDPTIPPRDVVISNISEGGVGLHTPDPLAIGSRWTLKLEAGPVRLCGVVEVVSCSAAKSGHTAGLRFVKVDA